MTFPSGFTLTLSGLLLAGIASAAEPRIPLLELYTSEGCNSCPPADRWVSALPRPQLVPNRMVVLAFHVDYWNYLGWRDRFSQSRFTDRQRERVTLNRLRTAYTPQLLLNGRDLRRTDDIESRVSTINASNAAVSIRLKTGPANDRLQVNASVTPASPNSPRASLFIAIYENNLESHISAGENRGERLRHDYVVRTLIGPIALDPGRPAIWQDRIAIGKDWKRPDLGVAAFVQADDNGEILQATAQEIR
jgi:hypothetical protein